MPPLKPANANTEPAPTANDFLNVLIEHLLFHTPNRASANYSALNMTLSGVTLTKPLSVTARTLSTYDPASSGV